MPRVPLSTPEPPGVAQADHLVGEGERPLLGAQHLGAEHAALDELGPGHGVEAVHVAAVDRQHERPGLPGLQPALDHVGLRRGHGRRDADAVMDVVGQRALRHVAGAELVEGQALPLLRAGAGSR